MLYIHEAVSVTANLSLFNSLIIMGLFYVGSFFRALRLSDSKRWSGALKLARPQVRSQAARTEFGRPQKRYALSSYLWTV